MMGGSGEAEIQVYGTWYALLSFLRLVLYKILPQISSEHRLNGQGEVTICFRIYGEI